MIGIETLLKDLNEALNVNLADNSRRFEIIPDGGEYAGFTREKNNITEYIDGVGSITQSSITPLASGIEVSTLELSVAVAVKLEQSKGVPDEELFLPVRNAISEYASTAKTKAIDGYAVSITATQPYAGEINIRPEIGRSIIYTFTVDYVFIENGFNSRGVKITFESNEVPYDSLTVVRVPIQDGGAFPGSGGVAKNLTLQTAFELQFTTPAIKGSAFCAAVDEYILTGVEKSYEVKVESLSAVGDAAKTYLMTFGQCNLSSQGIQNVGYSVTLVESFV